MLDLAVGVVDILVSYDSWAESYFYRGSLGVCVRALVQIFCEDHFEPTTNTFWTIFNRLFEGSDLVLGLE